MLLLVRAACRLAAMPGNSRALPNTLLGASSQPATALTRSDSGSNAAALRPTLYMTCRTRWLARQRRHTVLLGRWHHSVGRRPCVDRRPGRLAARHLRYIRRHRVSVSWPTALLTSTLRRTASTAPTASGWRMRGRRESGTACLRRCRGRITRASRRALPTFNERRAVSMCSSFSVCVGVNTAD